MTNKYTYMPETQELFNVFKAGVFFDNDPARDLDEEYRDLIDNMSARMDLGDLT